MKKGIRITLQIILYILSHGILIVSHEFPNDLMGIIVVSLFVGLSTYFLWNKTSKKIIINTILIFLVSEILMLMGGEGVDISQKSSFYFSTLVHWLLPFIMIMVLIFLLIKILIYKKTTEVPDNDDLKKK
jgi:large-conductance mechanosensitive channel